MTTSPKTAASKSDAQAIAECEADMNRFAAERDAAVARCRELMASEDPQKGIFHAGEIFNLQQDKLRLEVEMEFCRKKINRIRLGIDETSVQCAGGLVL